MIVLAIVHHYLLWHYAHALRELGHVAANLLWFVAHFFSLGPLTRSLFAPYRRITEERQQAFDFEDLAGFIIINLISRLIGLLLRLTLILTGLTSLALLSLGIVVTYLVWLLAPIVLISLLLFSIHLLIS